MHKQKLLVAALSCIAYVCSAQQMTNTLVIKTFAAAMASHPADCIVVTDMHDVALTRIEGDGDRFWQLSIKEQLKFIRRVGGFGIKHGLYLLGLTDRPSIERYVLKSKAPAAVKEQLLAILSPYEFDGYMATFYRACRSVGTQVGVFSNIGEHSYQYLQQKFPQAFKHFSWQQINTKANGYPMKPQERSYKLLFDTIRSHNRGRLPRHILFLDDKEANLQAFAKALAQEKDGKAVTYLPYCFTCSEELKQQCLAASFAVA